MPPATRPDLAFLREPRRVAAIVILGVAGATVLTFLAVRGELAGADARAYWGAVRVWIDGGDFMRPPTPYMPYVYVPWSIPLLIPWAALPRDVAWFAWRAVNVVMLLWTAAWAYRQHPLATALLLALLAAPIAATLDTGNITLLCALMVWAAAFVGPRTGGLLWAIATILKWFPAPLWLILPPRTRLWGLAWMALAAVLSLATWPATVAQLDIAINFPRPFRLDYLLLLWAAVPWLWAHPRLFVVAEWRPMLRETVDRARDGATAVGSAEHPAREAWSRCVSFSRRFVGLDEAADGVVAEAVGSAPAAGGAAASGH
jgi:hypothetical protein